MSSFDHGKEFITGWIHGRFNRGATCLDVGACDGNWWNRLGDYLTMDAVEIFQPNIEHNLLDEKYRKVYCSDVSQLEYNWYDLIIFGDVLEHMDVETAQRVLEYAKPRCRDMVISVPFLYRQGPMYGNQWEAHLQEDLTPELFDRRYPGFEIILRPLPNYAYYAKKWEDKNEDNETRKRK